MASPKYRGSSNHSAEVGDEHALINTRKVVDLGDLTGAVTIDIMAAEIFIGKLVGNVVLSFSGAPAAGWCRDIELRLTQDATGGYTVTWPASGAWPGTIPFEVSTSPNIRDHVGFSLLSDGSWTGYPVEAVA